MSKFFKFFKEEILPTRAKIFLKKKKSIIRKYAPSGFPDKNDDRSFAIRLACASLRDDILFINLNFTKNEKKHSAFSESIGFDFSGRSEINEERNLFSDNVECFYF